MVTGIKLLALPIAGYKEQITQIENAIHCIDGITLTHDDVLSFIIDNAGYCVAHGQPLYDYADVVSQKFTSGAESLLVDSVDREQLANGIIGLGETLCMDLLNKGLITKSVKTLVTFHHKDHYFLYLKAVTDNEPTREMLAKNVTEL